MSKKTNPTREAAAYRVSGPNVVLGHEPGEKFEAILEPVVEERLLASGNLERADAPSASTTQTTDGAKTAAAKE